MYCCYSVTKSCLTLCNPMDCSMPGFSVLHYLLELAQTHGIESVMPSNGLILCRQSIGASASVPPMNNNIYWNQLIPWPFALCHSFAVKWEYWTEVILYISEITWSNSAQWRYWSRHCEQEREIHSCDWYHLQPNGSLPYIGWKDSVCDQLTWSQWWFSH